MTTDQDLDQALDRWFDQRQVRANGRVIDVVTGRIERQRQLPAWRVSWRDTPVNAWIKPLAAVAAVIALVVAGYALLGGNGRIANPAPPTPPPSPTASAPPLPNGLVDPGRDYVMRGIASDPMAFTITAPAGWSGYGAFFMSGPNSSGAPNGIGISVNHDAQVVTDPCDSTTHSPPPARSGLSVDEVVAAISARTDLQVSGVTDATLAGYAGKRLDVQFPTLFTNCTPYVFAEPKGLYAQGLSNHWRVWLLDVHGETAIVVLADYAATPAADRAAAQAAIDSIRISR
jgi:hypothetical protein